MRFMSVLALFLLFGGRSASCQAAAADPFLLACKLPSDSADPKRKTVDALIKATRSFIGYMADANCETYERVLFRARTISLTGYDLKDLSPLAPLTQLEGLDLIVNKISDIRPLAKLVALRTLNLADNDITDIAPLKILASLDSLELEGNRISEIGPIGELVNLRLLNLSDNRISSIAPIAKLAKLQALQVQNNFIQSIDPASNLPVLTFLYAHQNHITSVAAFTPGPSLRRINLSGNSIPDNEITALQIKMGPNNPVVYEKQFNYANRSKLLREQAASMEIK